jgi:hypothetical protein
MSMPRLPEQIRKSLTRGFFSPAFGLPPSFRSTKKAGV